MTILIGVVLFVAGSGLLLWSLCRAAAQADRAIERQRRIR